MKDELVEKVARALLREMDADPDVYRGMHGSYKPWDDTARAVIPVVRKHVLEEAAKVAERKAEYHMSNADDDYTEGQIAFEMSGLARSIRNLGSR